MGGGMKIYKTVAFIFLFCWTSFSQNAGVIDVGLSETKNYVFIKVTFDAPVPVICYELENPARIVIDPIGDVTILDGIGSFFIEKGMVKQIRRVIGAGGKLDFFVVDLQESVPFDFRRQDNIKVVSIRKQKPPIVVAVKPEEEIEKKETERLERLARREAEEQRKIQEEQERQRKRQEAVAQREQERKKREALRARNRGLTYQRRKNLGKAEEYYRKAIHLDPIFATAYHDLGTVLSDKGKYDEAEKEFFKALEIDSGNFKVHSSLGKLYELKGDREKALEHWRIRAKMGDPFDEWTKFAEKKVKELEGK
ncbi:hypothetical protein B9J78_01820 [bacterium Unc6]|nr:hypothetical protein [bacterium Unc6]